jgi:hypothetical protein
MLAKGAQCFYCAPLLRPFFKLLILILFFLKNRSKNEQRAQRAQRAQKSLFKHLYICVKSIYVCV